MDQKKFTVAECRYEIEAQLIPTDQYGWADGWSGDKINENPDESKVRADSSLFVSNNRLLMQNPVTITADLKVGGYKGFF